MFLGSADFFENLMLFRTLWIRGRLGGGKTLLAFAIAKHLIDAGDFYGVISNIPHTLRYPTDGTMFDCIVILDEAWQFADSRDFKTNPREYGAFARKGRTLWLYPSVIPVDARMRYMFVEPTWKIGHLLWGYRGGIDIGYCNTEFAFALFRPSKYFGLFSTTAVPFADGGVTELWKNTMAILQRETQEEMAAMRAAMGLGGGR